MEAEDILGHEIKTQPYHKTSPDNKQASKTRVWNFLVYWLVSTNKIVVHNQIKQEASKNPFSFQFSFLEQEIFK